MMLRGFSRLTSYNCTQCHHKCCATEYDLPLFPEEASLLSRNYPFVSFFIKSSKSIHWLLRGDSCPFLTSLGLCELHNTQYKPLSCQIYPLIFWKTNLDETIAWINPCRGTGFNWVSDRTHLISDQHLDNLYDRVKNRFSSYWGEKIDINNPFERISQERIREEIDLFKHTNELNLVQKMAELDYSANFKSLLNHLTSNDPLKIDLNKIINAVVQWLCWSPVGLQLTFFNAKIIIFTAAMWITLNSDSIFPNNNNSNNQKRFLQQIGSFLATAISPSFWNQVENGTQIVILRKFAVQTQKILTGTIPQQFLSDFNEN